MSDEGGDPACWLGQVCDRCGRLVDERPRPPACPACGEPLPEEEEEEEDEEG